MTAKRAGWAFFKWLHSFLAYLGALIRHFYVLLSGLLGSLIITLPVWLVPLFTEEIKERLQAWAVFAAAPDVYFQIAKWFFIVCVVLASFLAWNEEREELKEKLQELERIKGEQNEPKLFAKIIQITLGDPRDGRRAVAVLVVSLGNDGADSIARNYSLEVSRNGHQLRGHPMLVDKRFTIHNQEGGPLHTYSRADVLYEKTTTPIKRGDVKVGPLVYTFDSAAAHHLRICEQGAVWSLTFMDYKDKKYETSYTMGARGIPYLAYIPGSGGKLLK